MTPFTRWCLVVGCFVLGLLELPRAVAAVAGDWGGPYAEHRSARSAPLLSAAPSPALPAASAEALTLASSFAATADAGRELRPERPERPGGRSGGDTGDGAGAEEDGGTAPGL